MEKKSFVFYESWQRAIDELPADIQLEIYQAITAYAINKKSIELSPMAKVAFSFIKQDLDRNAKKYADRCMKNKENSIKGGAPKGNKNALKTTKTTDRVKKQPKQPDNENDNVNEDGNDNVNGSIKIDNKEILSLESIKKEAQASSCMSDFDRFNYWIKDNAPYCANPRHFPHQMTEEELVKLKKKYSGSEIANIITQIENRKDLRKRYSNLYRTVLNWAKRDYGY
ncbi:DUF6291 domain-containing protein [Bacteroides sp. 51]|uniref:DUF6291 domain-containing protein n=1 Tax=Bacteroides sp. 51 TaxID=2302938 RepID=UPI0013D6831C|nr:DUF6291 domain-containing protein [Bacteroides sp. 51]NDV84254.1 hypothetical protein [Bacteroides sp. 51]